MSNLASTSPARAMLRLAGLNVVFLLVLVGRQHIGASSDRNKGGRFKAFEQCVLQNLPFALNARENHQKLTKETTASSNTSSFHRENTRAEPQIEKMDFKSEISPSGVKASLFQTRYLVSIFAICYRTVPELRSMKSAAEIVQFISTFVRNMVTLDEMNSSDERGSKYPLTSLLIHLLNSNNMAAATTQRKAPPPPIFSSMIPNVTNYISKCDEFWLINESLEAVSLIATAMSILPVKSGETPDVYRDALVTTIHNLDNSVGTFSDPSKVVECVIKELSSYGISALNEEVQTLLRQKRESITIEDWDLENCANTVKVSQYDDPKIWESCKRIFQRGEWDAKADRTLDGDIRKLIQLIYEGKRENLIKVLDFIDIHVPKYVRELIVSYDTIINEFELNDDFNLPVNQRHFRRIKSAVGKIKSMNGDHPAEKYIWAKQIHKDMLKNMLVNLESVTKAETSSDVPENESITITNKIIKNCSNTVKQFSEDVKVRESCNKIFNRGVWDEKADKTLDGDIRKLIRFIYNDNRENLANVLNFIDKYVPKQVRELTVSYDTLINVFEEREDFNQPINKPYFQKIKTAVIKIKSMDGEHPAEKYEMARQIDKNMHENMMVKLKGAAKRESITITDEDIQNCAAAIRLDSDESEVLVRCTKIFQRGFWDAKADRTLDSDIRKLMALAYNGQRENLVKVLKFIDSYVPKYVRELIVSYDTIINEFEKFDDFNLPMNEPQFQKIKSAVLNIKLMNGGFPAENYKLAKNIHKDILESMLSNLNVITSKESISITDKDIGNCANSVKHNYKIETEVLVSCSKIFNRGYWDEKADNSLDEDIRKLISVIYDGKRENIVKLLYFIDNYVPKDVRELVVSYYSFIREFEKYENLDAPVNQPYFQQLHQAIKRIKNMDGSHPGEKYTLARQTHKDMLETMLGNFGRIEAKVTITKENAVQNCILAIREETSNMEELCNMILKKEENRMWFTTDDVPWLKGDLEHIVRQAYDGRRQNFLRVLTFVRSHLPYAEQTSEAYKILLDVMEKNGPLSRSEVTEFIQNVNTSLHDFNDSKKLKSVLRAILVTLNSRFRNLKEKVIQVCVDAIQSDFTGVFTEAKKQCSQILKKEDNRDWVIGQSYYEDDVKEIVRRAYNGKLQYLNKILSFVRYEFPYSSQDVLGYFTILEELEKHKQLDLTNLYELLERVKSSLKFSDFPEETKTKFKTLKNILEQNVKGKEQEIFQIFIQAIKAGYFTKEELNEWKQFFGGENDYTEKWITYDYVDKLIALTYVGKQNNLETVVHVINTFYFANQRVVGYKSLVKEIEKYEQQSEYILKIIDRNIDTHIEANDLSREYQNKLKKLKERLKILNIAKKINKEEALRKCIEAVKRENWSEAKIKCDILLSQQSSENFSGNTSLEKIQVEQVINPVYSGSLVNVDRVLNLVDIFPYTRQQITGYSHLMVEIKKKINEALYFSAINQLKEKIKQIIFANTFQDLHVAHKRSFVKMREELKKALSNFVAKMKKYTAPKETLNNVNETEISNDNIRIKMAVHYDLPPYFSTHPIDNELRKLHEDATACISDYKEFVLPYGWMSHTDHAKVDVWVFNDQDIFHRREGFATYSVQSNQYLNVDGIFLYRQKENEAEGRIKNFKHEFMHVLVIGGIGKSSFASSIPLWFHDGLAELALHGPCNKQQFYLLNNYLKSNINFTKRDTFMNMICLGAEQQKEFSNDFLLNYFLSYFNVMFLRMRHPEFLQEIIIDAHNRGWEGAGASSASARKKLCDLSNKERYVFYRWMEKGAENYTTCYDDQPNSKFKLSYTPYTSDDGLKELSLSAFADGKFSWKTLIDAFNDQDFVHIDKQIELYRTTLKKQIEKLNLLPLNDMRQQKIYMNIVLRFINEIHSRREEISLAYYYHYADAFLKLVFDDIVIPAYQRASLEKNDAFILREEIKSAFHEFLRQAFFKDMPPDSREFLKWYNVRCREIDFCASDDFESAEEILGGTSNFEDIEFLRLDPSSRGTLTTK